MMFHEVSDSLDPARLPEVYAKDGILQYANVPPVQGLDNLKGFFGPIFEKLELMRHDISYFDLVGDKIYQACTITYRAKNDPQKEEIVVPALGVFHILPAGDDAGKMKKAEVYIDPSPLMAAIARAG
ncbi:putative ntf2-like protein [Phaeoacremonium minimum UCRPA7]|uniref:Putative ntf2-like protein n=1 Tax=Phaeoacremonium minimum (strain UCR-PA7) TaxID=1286976 RepID=R8BGE5_PHAM7|nr:putative ntf2-like protein [Phaeoacremonium minimum UCRPA7]EON98388.1 putative ntf2-like protein [Phaeoacremonium minimum UCRPA7]